MSRYVVLVSDLRDVAEGFGVSCWKHPK